MPIFNPKTVTNFLTYEKEEKVGFLWKKRSEQKKAYKRRYFILCGNILAYFDKKLDKEPLGIIFLDCHIVEMLDDLKMAIRFRGPGELCRSYILKGETAEEIEDWMRAISRCSIEYITLTLEDLEDHYKALSTVKQASSSVSNNKSPSLGGSNNSSFSLTKTSSIFSKRRSNPFNNNNNRSNSTSSTTTNSPPIISDVPTSTPLTNNQSDKQLSKTNSSQNSNSLLNQSKKSPPPQPARPPPPPPPQARPQPPSLTHTQWLLTQNWEQLNASLKAEFLKSNGDDNENQTSDSKNSNINSNKTITDHVN
uniref:PH domain-containing protein n=1 Tax=Trichobilharzia regenti TaxID=157069 RepID=A0AA85ISA7_TRIRE|nr:unnamed protein product [Trichobilharzia regenti]